MLALLASLVFPALSISDACAQEPGGESLPAPEPADARLFRVELALAPFLRQQQIEGPARDDLVQNEIGLVTALTATVRPIPYLEAGLFFGFDAGTSERVVFDRPGASGMAAERMRIAGGYFELALGILLRGRYGPGFVELGWTPLMVRGDETRDDLANTLGATEGLFLGNPAVGYLFGAGVDLPLTEALVLTLSFRFRIRYLVSRDGEPLEGDQEFGQMIGWPYLGAAIEL